MMAERTVQKIPAAGGSPTFSAADTDGDSAPTGRSVYAHIRNGSASSVDVTFTTPVTVHGVAVEDPETSIPAGEDLIVPLVPGLYSSMASWTYSDATDVDVAVLKVP